MLKCTKYIRNFTVCNFLGSSVIDLKLEVCKFHVLHNQFMYCQGCLLYKLYHYSTGCPLVILSVLCCMDFVKPPHWIETSMILHCRIATCILKFLEQHYSLVY